MTTKSSWQAVYDQMTEEDRQRLGDPPTGEEVLAYMRGELSGEEEARVRALLVAYPELARTLTHPFPSEEEGEVFSEEELSRHYAEFQTRIGPKEARVMPFRALSAALAIAATLAVVFGAMLVQARREQARPFVAAEVHDLLPDGRRGSGDSAERVAVAGQPFAVRFSISDQPELPAYRIDVVDTASGRVLSSELHERNDSETFQVIMRRGLDAGRYKLALYGVDGPRAQHLTDYAFRVSAR